jgi:thiol:disulfide interchange protein DsbC
MPMIRFACLKFRRAGSPASSHAARPGEGRFLRRLSTLTLVVTALCSSFALAAGEEAGVKKLLESKFPKAEIKHVAKTNLLGLYEAMIEDRLIYTDAKVNYLFLGEIIDTNKMVSLTAERMQKLRVLPWEELPLDLAIKTVRGDGSRKLAVFSDADCPFCKRLESELKEMDNVTFYTFLLPIDQLHPDAGRKSKMIWCSSDRSKAYYDFMLQGSMPSATPDCDTPVARIAAIGQKYRINATPTMVFSDGRIVSGALPRDQIEKEFTRIASAGKVATETKKP